MKQTLLLSLIVGLSLPSTALGQASTIYDEPLSDRRVSYVIDASLDPDTRTVSGSLIVSWRNPDRVPVSKLYFHLYLNAFRDNFTTYMREGGGRFRGVQADPEERGSISVDSIHIVSDVAADNRSMEDIGDRLSFVQPDDQNPYDETVAELSLDAPVPPGQTITLSIDFTSRLPRVSARTGWEETDDDELFFLVAQWFPKLAVYEVPGQRNVSADATRGEWNAHQFHANTEFYADFGTYRVTIDVPQSYVVGATGVRVAEQTENERKLVTYEADDVHDFAWTASPAFVEVTDSWRHVNIRLLLQPERANLAPRQLDALRVAMDRLDAWVGEYPYTTLTLVDALGGAVGMEYPTFITAWSTSFPPPRTRTPIEDTIIHEFAHQYFYGMLASNEFEEPWLDEGFTSFFEARIMRDAYGAGSSFSLAGINIGQETVHRLAYTKSTPERGRIMDLPWEQSFGDYGKTAYYKSSTVLATLEGLLGWDTLQQVFQEYYRTWRFRHPTTRDFIDIAENISKQDLDWFFDQFVYGTAVVDYRVDRVVNRAVLTDDTTRTFETEIRVARAADAVFPQTIRLYFADGTSEDLQWDGVERWKTFEWSGTHRVTMAELDPDHRIKLEINRLNNRRSSLPRDEFAREMQLSAISLLQLLFSIF